MIDEADLTVAGADLERGNEPIFERAAELAVERGFPVTMTVVYHRPHAKPGDLEWSSPDTLTVFEDGQIHA